MAKFQAPKGHSTSSTQHSRAAISKHAAKPAQQHTPAQKAALTQKLSGFEQAMDNKGGPKSNREIGLEKALGTLTGKPHKDNH